MPAELLDGDAPGTAVLARLREFWSHQGDLRPAIAATRALLRWNAEQHGSEHPDTLVELSALGALAMRAGRAEEGGGLVERAWEGVRGQLGEGDVRLAVVAQNAARFLAQSERWAEADDALNLALRIRQKATPDALGMLSAQRAEVLVRLARHSEAIPLLQQALEWYEHTFGDEHPTTSARARALGDALAQVGRTREALPHWRRVHRFFVASGDGEARAAVAHDLGAALESLDERAEALRMLEDSVRWTREAGELGRPHPALPARVTVFASAELRRGRVAVAEGLLREAVEAERALSGDRSVVVGERYAALGAFVARTGRVDEALGWLDTATSLLRTGAGDNDPRTRQVADSLVGLLLVRAEHALQGKDRQLAAVALARAWEVAAPVLGFVHEKTRRVRDLRDRHRLN